MSPTVTIHHNLAPLRFVWFWMKYVTGVDNAHHCTNVRRGPYSKKLTKHNPDLAPGVGVVCDEQPAGTFAALYICGVAAQGHDGT